MSEVPWAGCLIRINCPREGERRQSGTREGGTSGNSKRLKKGAEYRKIEFRKIAPPIPLHCKVSGVH